ncbi:SUMO-activating enzyme subunit 1 [Microtus ochrogaster]|uniref:SUMO-activating enzyme subunit 1 n=1 Tax=Microtus ochrogaster TaxID=79684 RepID=A0A8J6KRY0_MICOH|nr:SUMO-activating enzyme subunit 1 [Microtus ochrogaster]
MVKKKVLFCPVKEALEVDWSGEKAKAALKRTAPDDFLLQELLKFRTDKGRDPSLIAPVCAVVGGILAQEIVKALSQWDPPHNFFFFDGMKGNGVVECLGPK